MRKITNIHDLRLDMIEMYEKLRTGQIGLREMKEISNTAGKIMSSAKLQLEYNNYLKATQKIPFLDVNDDIKDQPGQDQDKETNT